MSKNGKVKATKEFEPAKMSKVVRSWDGLSEALFDEMDLLRQGYAKTERANSMAKLATVMVKAVDTRIKLISLAPGRKSGLSLALMK